jgi:hypothetical protein
LRPLNIFTSFAGNQNSGCRLFAFFGNQNNTKKNESAVEGKKEKKTGSAFELRAATIN